MSYFNQFKNATRETKRILVLLALMFGFSALAATHKVSAIAVDPSRLNDGAQVVMYHNGTGKLVGCQNGKEVTKDNKEVTDADAKYYVFTVKKDGNKIALLNGAGYVPQVTGSNSVFSVSFSFAWKTSLTSSSYFNVNYNSASDVARLYIEYTYWWTTHSGYMSRTNSGMSAKEDPDNTAADDADWTFHQYVLDDGTGGHGTAPTKHGQLTAWADNAGYQEVGYIGLGNKNQVLASACVNIKNGDIPTIAYRLFGKTNFLSAVSVYARKRDKDQDYNSDKTAYGSFENTFAHIFDYRNPEKNCGAIFLGFTYDVPEQYEPASFTSNVKLDAGEYVIYLVATAFEMIKKCDVLVKLLDEFGIWQNVAEKISAENPREKIPAKTSSQRFIWFAFHGYDFGDERIRAAKAEYKPYVVLFYGSLIVYIFTVLV